MSENFTKPPVYAFCKAGCGWRVPHYSELEGAAYMTPYAEGLELTLGQGSYKIFSDYAVSVQAAARLAEQWQSVVLTGDDTEFGKLKPDAYDGAEVRFLDVKKEVREVQIDDTHASMFFCIDALIEINGDRRWVLVHKTNVVDMEQTEIDALYNQPLKVVLLVDNRVYGLNETEVMQVYKLNKDARLVIAAEGGVNLTHDGEGNVKIV